MDDKKSFNKLYLFIPILLVLLVVAGLVLSGYLSILWKQPQQKVVLVTRVCDDAIVAQYNKVSAVKQTGDTYNIDEAGLKKLVADIKSKGHYSDDATCQSILLAAAIQNKDNAAAKEANTAIVALYGKQIYSDAKLNVRDPITLYELYTQESTPNNDSNQEPKGGE